MSNPRVISRLHEDKAKRVVHVFSEYGYELTVALGFRDRRLKVGRSLNDEAFDELRAAARAFEQGRRERRAARREQRATERANAGVVTRLEHDTRHGRVYVDLDGRYALTATLDQLVEVGLVLGKELDESTVAALREGYNVVRVAAVIDRLTGYRPRTVAEIRRRLAEKGIEGPLIDAAIAARSGEAYGVLSDLEFARWYTEHRGVPRGKGFRALVPELRRLGVADEALAVVEREYATDEAWGIALARAMRGLDPNDPKLRARFVARLARAGFSYGDARDYLDARAASDEELDEAAASEA